MAPPPRPSAEPKTPLYCDVLRDGPLRCPPDEVPSPPPPASHGRSTFVTALIIAIPVLAFLALCLSILIFVQRRRLRQRRAVLLEAALAPAAPATFPDDDGPGGEGEGVHHVWHIRTVGLDDAAIESIALTRYRAAGGGGVLGASDCTVCLGEFHDGELLRLLPKCAHAFHVQCIDTWLRAHVSCPLCRADVTADPAAAAAATDAEQPPGADGADASAEQSASNTRTLELERHGQQANEQQELRVQIDQQPDHSSTPERPAREPGARAQNFRRVASMDSPSPPTASAEEAPEDDQAGGEKQGTGGAVCCEVSPEPGHQLNRPAMKRSLSASSRWTLLSRHCRTRSSLLPL